MHSNNHSIGDTRGVATSAAAMFAAASRTTFEDNVRSLAAALAADDPRALRERLRTGGVRQMFDRLRKAAPERNGSARGTRPAVLDLPDHELATLFVVLVADPDKYLPLETGDAHSILPK